jgi:His Kinase A (phospho-acceptor) domain
MNQMLERLEKAQSRQRRFVSDASHELRSPIASIRQHVEVALAHPDVTGVEDLAEVVLTEDVRLQHLAEDLLLLAKIDEGLLDLVAEPVDLDDILFVEARRLRDSTNIRVDSTGVTAGRVVGDERQLSRMVRNLADNAARHARATVALSLREEIEAVVLALDDDGDGVPWLRGPGCSRGSSASKKHGAGTREAAGWGWRSSPRLPWLMRVRSESSTVRSAAPASKCAFRDPPLVQRRLSRNDTRWAENGFLNGSEPGRRYA